MTTRDLTTVNNVSSRLLAQAKGKDQRSRLEQFIGWNGDTPLDQVDLDAYALHLQTRTPREVTRQRLTSRGTRQTFRHTLKALAPSAAAAHVSTVRKALRELTEDNDYRRLLFARTPDDASAADKAAFVNEAITRLENVAKPSKGKVEVIKEQDKADDKHTRLTTPQADRLMSAPGVDTLIGIRDTAIITLMLCTGLREAEICQLEVNDLRRDFGGKLAINVKRGKGAKQRMVPYGELAWCLTYVDRWLASAGITEGLVFRSMWKSGKTLRNRGLSVDAVQDIVSRYPVAIGDSVREIKPHDLRRTYARLQYEAGMDLVAIQQNLGHANLATTLGYIGTLDASARQAKSIFHPPHMDKIKKMAS